MLKQIAMRVLVSAALVTVALGARQAMAATTASTALCPEPGNWCASSLGGDINCTQCCLMYDHGDGVCFGYENDQVQRCLCTG